MTITLARALVALLAIAPLPALANTGQCKLIRIAEWPVRFVGNIPVVDGAINGKKIGVMLDTGAFASLITKAAAERLDLLTRGTAEYMVGVGGASQILVTRIDELNVAGAVRKGMRVRVGGERPIPGVDFVLGDDFFRAVDIEFEYAKGVVRIYQPKDCDKAWLAYWDRNAHQVAMENDNKIVIPVRVNGRTADALLDSGASGTVVAMQFAQKVGFSTKGEGVLPAGCSMGFGADFVHNWVAPFDTVQIGEQTISNPRLRVSDFTSGMYRARDAPPDMLLGTDFLRTHRVYVARSQRKVYFSYLGGQVFPVIPRLDCGEFERGSTPEEVQAAYDKAIAANPGDAKALLGRGSLRLAKRDYPGALQDLDAALRIEPGNPVALDARSNTRASLRDYAGALADSEAAIANGMRSAPMYVNRAMLRRALRDSPGIIAEYDEALKLDPRYVMALRGRGHHLFYQERYEAAERDFAALLSIRPHGIDAIWLSLARARRGAEGTAILEQELPKLKEGDWPTPVMLHMLGRLDLAALMEASARGADEKVRKERECEANYYAAAHLVARGKRADALPLLEKARDGCPSHYIEREAAYVELGKR